MNAGQKRQDTETIKWEKKMLLSFLTSVQPLLMWLIRRFRLDWVLFVDLWYCLALRHQVYQSEHRYIQQCLIITVRRTRHISSLLTQHDGPNNTYNWAMILFSIHFLLVFLSPVQSTNSHAYTDNQCSILSFLYLALSHLTLAVHVHCVPHRTLNEVGGAWTIQTFSFLYCIIMNPPISIFFVSWMKSNR